MSTLRLPHLEQTSRPRQSGTAVSAPIRRGPILAQITSSAALRVGIRNPLSAGLGKPKTLDD
jgi:hypothetical protein